MPDDDLDDDSEIGTVVLDITAAIAPIAAGDPTVGALGALSALGLSIGAKGILGRRQRRRLARLEESVREMAGNSIPELLERIANVERSAVLAELALRGSLSASTDEQADANGRLLVHGVLEEAHDEAEFVMGAVSQLGELEIGALEALRAASQHPSTQRAAGNVLQARVPEHLVDSVLASLAGRGMILVDPPGFGGFRVTPLGQRVADELALPEAE